MVKKFLLRNVAMLLCVVMFITSTARTTYGFIVLSSDPLVNTFVPTELPDEEGSVTINITKNVYGDYESADGLAGFRFIIRDITEESKHLDEEKTVTTDAQGKASFVLEYDKNHIGKTFTYSITEAKGDIPNMEYTEEEQIFTVTVGEDPETKDISLAASETEFTFTNIYTKPSTEITPAELTVKIVKNFDSEGDDFSDKKGFEFVLTSSSGAELGRVSTNEGGTASFEPIKITEAGEFRYTVYETEGGISGMVYARPQTFVIIAEVENNAVVVRSVSFENGEAISVENGSIELEFINKYEKPPVPERSVTINVSTIIKNNIYDTPLSGFEFDLIPEYGEPRIKESDEEGKESFVISGITAPARGETEIIEFEIIQYKDDRYPELIYDETVYNVKIYVTDDDGDGIPEIVVKINEIETNEVQFINRYPGADEVAVKVDIEKIITNETGLPTPSADFHFEIVDASGNVAGTAAINGQGEASISIPFSKDNVNSTDPTTFTYTIREVKGSEEGFVYDEAEYGLQITVKLDEDGKPNITHVIFNGNENGAVLAVFTNVYEGPDPEEAKIPFVITKEVTNLGITKIGPEQFEFLIEDLTEGTSRRVRTDVLGNFETTLKFDKEDVGKTFEYRVSEVNGKRAGVTYDSSVYNVSVAVSRDGDKVKADITVNGTAAGELRFAFKNTYKPGSIPSDGSTMVPVKIVKTVISEGDKEIGPSGFEFVIEQISDEGEENYSRKKVTDINGEAEFQLIFDKHDIGEVYKYKVYETAGNIDGMVYDTREYVIEVGVYAGGENGIGIAIYVNGEEVPEAVLEFENKYNVKDEGNPETGIAIITQGMVAMFISGTMFVLLVLTDKRFKFTK